LIGKSTQQIWKLGFEHARPKRSVYGNWAKWVSVTLQIIRNRETKVKDMISFGKNSRVESTFSRQSSCDEDSALKSSFRALLVCDLTSCDVADFNLAVVMSWKFADVRCLTQG
jgi:hypothetical protein